MPDITGGAGTGSVGTPGLTRAVPLSGWFGSARSASIGGLYAAGAVGSITYNANPASTDWLLVDNADRLYPWGDYCGIPGGIPERTTIYAALGVSGQAPTYVQSVTAAQITAAIVSASAVFLATGIGQIVYLFPGTYNIGEVSFGNRSGVTVCGAGPGQTVIHTTGTYGFLSDSHSFSVSSRIAITNGTWLEAGSTYIILASAPTAAFSVGNLIMINQEDDHNLWGTDIGPYHRTAYTEPSGTPYYDAATGTYNGLMRFVSRITSVSGNRIDFAAPLPMTLTYALNPRAYPMSGGPPASLCGIEELTIDCGGTADAAIRFRSSDRCWVKDVEIYSCLAGHGAISYINSAQPEVRRCYIHDVPGYPDENEGMAIMLWYGGSNALIIDNIAYRTGQALMFNGASGCAVIHNYFWTLGGSFGGGHGDWLAYGINVNHGPHGFMNLYEGNIIPRFMNDAVHGSTSHQVLFRNQIHGLDGDTAVPGDRELVDICKCGYYHTLVGNILGDSSWTPAYYEVPPPTAIGHGPESSCIYQLGWGSGDSGDAQTQSYVFEFWTKALPDADVAATLLRHGNYDYYNHAVVWDAGIASQSIPDSLFYDSKPAWFGSMEWPPIGPDLATRVNDIPAKKRWDAYVISGVLADLFGDEGTETCDLYLDWHTGTDNDLITDAIAAGSCRPLSPTNVPDAYPGTTLTMMRIDADAASPASGFVSCGGSIYDIGDTTQGVAFDMSNAAREEMVMAFFPSGPNVASMGFMFRTDLNLEGAYWAPAGIGASGDWAFLGIRLISGVVRLYIHTSQGYSPTYVPLERNTWYWVTIQYNRTAGYAYAAVYDPATWAQVGTTVALAFGSSPPAAWFWCVGGQENQGNQTAAYWLYGPTIIDWTDGTFPLLPTPAA